MLLLMKAALRKERGVARNDKAMSKSLKFKLFRKSIFVILYISMINCSVQKSSTYSGQLIKTVALAP
jgi:hypothetical protein